eukprot:scaffold1782_cov123-Isochrysis_galbana.AAC.1
MMLCTMHPDRCSITHTQTLPTTDYRHTTPATRCHRATSQSQLPPRARAAPQPAPQPRAPLLGLRRSLRHAPLSYLLDDGFGWMMGDGWSLVSLLSVVDLDWGVVGAQAE